jgi:type II secretory pathway pseudopilin PulG
VLIAVLLENRPVQWGFWNLVTAGEVAAWRLKWIALPCSVALIWVGAWIARSIRQNPVRFMGLLAARVGVTSAVVVALLIATLIGITVPERLRQRQFAVEAEYRARGYTIHRAFLEYRDLHGTFPADPDKYIDELRTLPDADGSIAEALRFLEPKGYEASAQLAAASTKVKPLVTRGVALRNGTTIVSPETTGVSFNSYKLRLPGQRRLFGTDDDYVLENGVIKKASEVAPSTSSSSIKTP